MDGYMDHIDVVYGLAVSCYSCFAEYNAFETFIYVALTPSAPLPRCLQELGIYT